MRMPDNSIAAAVPRSIQSFLLLAPGEWRDLFSSRHHPRLFQRERARFILSRVRIIAALLAILAPFRLAVDDLLLAHHLYGAAEYFDKYTYLTFILMASIGVFPMALLEILAFTLSLLAVFALPLWLREDPRILPELIDLALVASVAALASMSQLQSMKRLFVQSSTDPLTGLLNRRAGEDLLALLFAQAERHPHSLSIAMLDVDNFKGVNDNWGYETVTY
jgi:predicted signal transduction protein with EAL and GGDEF domain